MVCGGSVLVFVLECNICVLSSFAIILTRKRDLAVLRLLFFGCLFTVKVLCLFLTVSCAGLQCVIMVFPDQTHFVTWKRYIMLENLTGCRALRFLFLFSLYTRKSV